MSLFALPITSSSRRCHSKPLTLIPSLLVTTKRKRVGYSSSNESIIDLSDEERIINDLSTNPTSLTLDEINQYRLAGLGPNDSLPDIKGWPHRGFSDPSELATVFKKKPNRSNRLKKSFNEDESDQEPNLKAEIEEANIKNRRGPGPRLQHISVLTTILHRCLLNRDIPRASRAWALLIRMQVSGYGIDLKDSGYWGIGAELLIQRSHTYSNPENSSDLNLKTSAIFKDDLRSSYVQRVTTKLEIIEGLRRASEFYERLILEYPFFRQHSTYISALDWWPVMISSEIYRIQFEQKQALQNLKLRIMEDEERTNLSDEDSQSEYSEEKIDECDEMKNAFFYPGKRPRELRKYLQAEHQIRKLALDESIDIITRLKERMTAPPYSENSDLMRLRGMLAMYVGDLSVPPKPEMEDVEPCEYNQMASVGNLGKKRSLAQRRPSIRKSTIEYENGLIKRAQEFENAREFFDILAKKGQTILIPGETRIPKIRDDTGSFNGDSFETDSQE